MRPAFHNVQFAESVNICQRIRQHLSTTPTTPTVGVAGRSPVSLWGFWADVSSLLDKQQAASLCAWSASMMPGPQATTSGLDGCESFAFPSADGSDGQSELKMFLMFDHFWRISMIRFRCFSTGTSYHAPTIHLPFGKSRRQDQRMPWRPPADRWWRYHQLRRCRATQHRPALQHHLRIAVSPGEACQIQQCQISQAQMDAELYTYWINLNLNHTYNIL